VNQSKLVEILNRIPWLVITFLLALYFGYDYYSFENDFDSEKNQKISQISVAKDQTKKLQKKLDEAQLFFKSFEAKKAQLRQLQTRLLDMKNTLGSEINVPLFIREIGKKAKTIGMRVISIRPQKDEQKDFYEAKTFTLSFRGVFVQMLVFLQKLSEFKDIVRADDLDIRPYGPVDRKFVEIQGDLTIKVYQYRDSEEDKIGVGK
tara:strand:+ start:5467 stop:6081 length:615 start_codon:yes stop_codon:yes gene_type:complete